jgi:hypothetical protein
MWYSYHLTHSHKRLASMRIFERDSLYRMSREECIILQEHVPNAKIYRYNPEHLYPKLNGYGDKRPEKSVVNFGFPHIVPAS